MALRVIKKRDNQAEISASATVTHQTIAAATTIIITMMIIIIT